MVWRWASASVIGTSHIDTGDRLQDAYGVAQLCNGGVFAVVSDGAGSARLGAYGAWLTCRFLSVRVREWVRDKSNLPSDEELAGWIDELRDRIFAIATRRELKPREFAATLTAVIVTAGESITLQIGDSAVVGRNGADWEVLCWPENGEYASSTYFVTDDPEPRLNIIRSHCRYNAFALFSDGIGDLALSHLEQAAHAPFLVPMIRPVDAGLGAGRLISLSEKLAAYLASPSVCERTDDDKTLVLISKG
ncbi:PP2C family serine/threonine-protein phosphatase [Oceanibaculum nanhaiense]|uniref:PP2C family serine/threonine-protein phosphatase n=1 Tax=Oceanibaculum nanhaiense TaxID=1909734 RepID=UPI003D2B5794